MVAGVLQAFTKYGKTYNAGLLRIPDTHYIILLHLYTHMHIHNIIYHNVMYHEPW